MFDGEIVNFPLKEILDLENFSPRQSTKTKTESKTVQDRVQNRVKDIVGLRKCSPIFFLQKALKCHI